MTTLGFKFELGKLRGRYVVRDLSLPLHRQYIGVVDRQGARWQASTYATRPLVDDNGEVRLFKTREAAALALRAKEVSDAAALAAAYGRVPFPSAQARTRAEGALQIR